MLIIRKLLSWIFIIKEQMHELSYNFLLNLYSESVNR